MILAHSTTKEVGRLPKLCFLLNPTLTPFKKPAYPPLRERARALGSCSCSCCLGLHWSRNLPNTGQNYLPSCNLEKGLPPEQSLESFVSASSGAWPKGQWHMVILDNHNTCAWSLSKHFEYVQSNLFKPIKPIATSYTPLVTFYIFFLTMIT